MAVAETNKIITHGDGQSIATSIQNIANAINDQEKNVHLSDAQTITGAKTFTSPIKTSEIDNTAGNAMLRNKDTEGAIVLGSVSKKAVIMGSGDRPTYSKDGSDFAGKELALKSDVTGFSLPYYYASKSVFDSVWHSTFVLPSLSLINNFTFLFADAKFRYYDSGVMNTHPVHFASINDIPNNSSLYYTFIYCTNECELYLPNMVECNCYMLFYGSKFTKVMVEDGATVLWKGDIGPTFEQMANLTEIGAIDLTRTTKPAVGLKFAGCTKLKSIHMTHFHYSFSISASTAFEEADLVEILNNLDPVSTTQTLTMGATNLAKLTSDDILIATGKGWALA